MSTSKHFHRTFPALILLLFGIISNQQSYSQDIGITIDKTYFRSPLNIPLYLSGDYGELRTNHFHTGLDIKTNGSSGYKIYACADGYLGRIKVGHYGYGRVLYINHPNGLTTVYAHQSRFNDELEKYVREQQYENQNDQIDIYPDSTLFKFKKGDVVGYSGNSGTSSGPHLHFEIRKTENDHPLNPWMFGFDIKDEIPPTLYNIKVYPLDDTSSVNGHPNAAIIKILGSGKECKLAQTLTAYGNIGFAIHTIDMTNGSGNQCGPYSIDLIENDSDTLFSTRFEELAFETNRYINVHMDYLGYRDKKNSYHKSFIKGINQLPIYKTNKNNGWVTANGKNKKALKFVVKDINGNTSIVKFDMLTSKINLNGTGDRCDLQIKWDKDTTYQTDDIKITFPDSSLYDDLCFQYKQYESASYYYAPIHKLHDDDIPIMHPITLSLKTTCKDSTKFDKLTAVYINEAGKISNEGGTYEDGYITFTTRSFGKYSVMMDDKAPVISPALLYEGRLMGKGTSFSFSLADNLSGVKKYNAFIDDKWALGIYNPFKNKLTIDLDDAGITAGEHELILKVEDGKNNEAVYQCKFKR